MGLARVYNENIYPFSQEFKGEKITIKAGEFIEMEYMDAMEFHGAFSPMQFGADDEHLPQGFKKLRVEKLKDEPAKLTLQYACQACREKFDTASDLDDHTVENHLDLIEDEDVKKKLLKKQTGNKK